MANNNEGGVRSKDYLHRLKEGSGNVDAQGNFSIEVLRSALMNQYGLEMPNIRQEGVGDSIETTEIEGFICNKSAHWFAIRKIHGRYWNLNSTLEQPQLISHFHLAAEVESLQNEGYSVFVVLNGLPLPCTTAAGTSRGLAQYWWKEEDLIAGRTNATTAATDPWRGVGSGMRLDGKTTASETTSSTSVDDMTDEEMLQMALMASLTTATAGTGDDANEKTFIKTLQVAVPPEPPAGTDGAVRIQFRMPNGKRVIRRFLPAECVEVVYAFVEESCPCNGKQLELRYGFPPQDLASKRSMTVTEANLSGESIQGRHI
jgi:ataxin-3